MKDQGTGHDDVAAYVLDALSDQERAAFEAHLAGCESCRHEVAELRQVVDVLPLAVDLEEPSPALRDRIMEAVEAEPEAPPALVALRGGRPTPAPRRRWRLPEIVGVAVAAILILGLGLWNVHLQQQINQDRTALQYQQQVAAAIAAHAVVSPITGTGTETSATAALVQPRSAEPAYLIVQGLHKTPAQHVYELWLLKKKGATPRPATVFTSTGTATQIVPLPMPARGYRVAAVTVEPHRVPAPTGPAVLAGTLRT